jgi:hypothetical protein
VCLLGSTCRSAQARAETCHSETNAAWRCAMVDRTDARDPKLSFTTTVVNGRDGWRGHVSGWLSRKGDRGFESIGVKISVDTRLAV